MYFYVAVVFLSFSSFWDLVNLSISNFSPLKFFTLLQRHYLFIYYLFHSPFSFKDSYHLKFKLEHSANLWAFTFLVKFLFSVYVSWVASYFTNPIFCCIDSSNTASAASINGFVAKFILCWSWYPPVVHLVSVHSVARIIHLKHKSGCVKSKLLSRVPLFVTSWTIESVEFSRPEYWSG